MKDTNLNLWKRVRDGQLSITEAKTILKSAAGTHAESTSTWKRLCRLELATKYFRY